MKAKIILLFAATALILTAACDPGDKPPDHRDEQVYIDSAETTEVIPIDIGEGTTSFIFEVKDNKEDITVWKVHTNEETVGAALVGAGLIEGTVFAWGLMVEYVDGLRADFTMDNAFWAFYINGEMAMEGVDTTIIEEGILYAFVFTPA